MFQPNSDPVVVAQRLAEMGNTLNTNSTPQMVALTNLVEVLCVSESYDGAERRFVFTQSCHLVLTTGTGEWHVVAPPIIP